MIASIFAVDSKGGLGKDGTLPWPRDPSDLKFFREVTSGGIVVMGRKTWMDPMLPKPLPNRHNIVITSQPSGLIAGWDGVIDPLKLDQEISDLVHQHPTKDVFLIGGAQTLLATRHLIETAYITEFKGDYACDTLIDVDLYVNGLKCDEEAEFDNRIVRHYT